MADFAAAAAIGAYGQTDTDIWGHLRFGLDMIRAHAIPRADPYTFTSHGLWVNHEWGSDVVFALAWTAAGLAGLAAVRLACSSVTIGILNRRLAGLEWPWSDVALLAVAVLSMPLTLAVRPHDFSLPLYTLTLYALVDARRRMWLPAIFAAWANLHGGWLIGFAAVASYTVCHPSRRNIAMAVASAAATLANPFGIHLWLALFEAVTRGWGNVTEWQPAWVAAGPPGHQPLVLWLATAAAAVYFLRSGPRRDRFVYVWVALVGIMSLECSGTDHFSRSPSPRSPCLLQPWPAGRSRIATA